MGEGLYDSGSPDFPDRAYDLYRTMRDSHHLYFSGRNELDEGNERNERNERDERRGFYAVSRYEDVRAISNDAKRFSNEGVSNSVGVLPILQQIDSPLHDELRALVVVASTPRRASELAPRMRCMARELLARFAARGECDFMAEFARHFPSRVIGEMVGVPPEQREPMLEWTESLVGIQRNGARAVETAALAIAEVFKELLVDRRRKRRDDLMSALIDAKIDGGRCLTEQELLGFCFQLVLAGNDTTTNLIANGAVLLARHPEQRRELVREPARIANAIEEMLRYESPTQVLPRRVVEDVELHGVKVPAHSELRLIYGAANRDERFFADPGRFDTQRANARRHLAFGQGTHFCAGAALARLEAQVAFEELLLHLPEYELAAEPRWLRSAWARAHVSVPLRFAALAEGALDALA